MKKTIMEAFSELPFKILWKFESDDLPGKPENVKIAKWLPQQDVLSKFVLYYFSYYIMSLSANLLIN